MESSLFDYFNAQKSIEMKRELLYRYLTCYDVMYKNISMFNNNRRKFDKLMDERLKIPEKFSNNYVEILTDLLKNVCTLLEKE
jgi:hypothetical protein